MLGTVKAVENKKMGSNVFQTANTNISLCDETESFILNFFENQVSFKFCELIAFKSKLGKVDIASLFESGTPDVELLQLVHCNRIFVFSALEILELRELLSGAFVMLELNSIIHRRVIRASF